MRERKAEVLGEKTSKQGSTITRLTSNPSSVVTGFRLRFKKGKDRRQINLKKIEDKSPKIPSIVLVLGCELWI